MSGEKKIVVAVGLCYDVKNVKKASELFKADTGSLAARHSVIPLHWGFAQ